MILAGIDEAGYGPMLGPLVVGCSAFELAADSPFLKPFDFESEGLSPASGDVAVLDAPASRVKAIKKELPDLWAALRKAVSANRDKSGKRLHLNDSKKVYSPGLGLAELEKSVLSLARWCGHANDKLATLMDCLSPGCTEAMSKLRWYQPATLPPHPLHTSPDSLNLHHRHLQRVGDSHRVTLPHLAVEVVFEDQLNHLFSLTRNKASTLFSISARHIDRMLRNFFDRGLVLVCDRQGGRSHYGSLLRLYFSDYHLEILHESGSCSEYRLHRDGRCARIIFCEKAEQLAMPVALASMAAKYVRERIMGHFNAFWTSHQPGLSPTAGYYNDAQRFLDDIDATRQSLNIDREQLVRIL